MDMEWKEYKLGDLITFKSGGTPSKSNETFWGGTIPWVSAKNMYTDFISTSTMFITEEGLKSGSQLAPIGSILLLTRGSGLFNTIPICLVTSPVAYNQDVKCIFTKNDSIISNEFLFYWMISNKAKFVEILETTGIGAGKIATDRLLDISILVPPMIEQVRLLNVAKSILGKIENNNKINAKLEEMAQALFKSWFIDFEPFKVGRDGSRPAFGSGNFVESELGMIPEGWKVGKIEDLAERIASGGTPKSMNESYYKGDIQWYSTKELKDCFLRDSEKHISQEAYDNSSTKFFDKGTVLMAIYAAPTVGRLGVLTQKACFNQAAVGIAPKNEVGSYFIYWLLYSERNNLNNLASGAAQQNLNVGIVKSYPCILPKESVLAEYNEIISPIMDLIMSNSIENDNLAKTRDTLLPKLMSGEIEL